ncbi:hypothetical protein H6CHR_02248 [Variovorax sp. PBL-H6]|uniref:hypothetical protein n=1 Tax=Variovorax sp. PBL-H6 TaxID=434009 RepID=UPI0013197584|nr:hypothetical protein [Variovorax sp. PBL-H6]VTU24711.1 hypothetical protein H6CHR_02248 [Variovorax sp. PBL-H6]
MTLPQELPAAHCASVLCQVPARHALEFLVDGLQLGRWALGCWDTASVGEGVVCGRSLFDDQPSWVRPVADHTRMAVVYHVGSAPDALSPRIRATVEPIEAVEAQGNAPCCRISLHAERTPGMDDARWLRLMRCHEVEVLLIQARLALPHHPLDPLDR